MRKAFYAHEGAPFTGPDGGAMVIDHEVFAGEQGLPAGKYTETLGSEFESLNPAFELSLY